MGFLDHSTNNIILDAVLTDTGRQLLARNDGSFSISKFALGDDEINYSVISKYGRTVGREKIEKNTPIFEAITNQAVAQKYRLISAANPRITYLPRLESTTTSPPLLRRNLITTFQFSLEQKIGDSTNNLLIEPELVDDLFSVELSHVFFIIQNNTPQVDANQKATYLLRANNTRNPVSGGSSLSFAVGLKSIPDSTWQIYGFTSAQTSIRTYMKITGVSSGAVLDVPITINS